jgi:hypothetical protein
MAQSAALAFAHRDNSNGTTDSICRTCLATVANAFWEADLESAERNHECDSLRVAQIRTFREKPMTAKQRTAPPGHYPTKGQLARVASAERAGAVTVAALTRNGLLRS